MNEREHEDQRPVVTLAGGSADEGASLSRELDRAGAMLLAELIEADEVLHTRLDLAGGTATVASGVGQDPQFELGEALGRFGHLHPAVLSYLAEGDDRRPRRISDVCGSSAWRNNPAFLEVFGDSRAIHQLSLVTELSDRVGVGWVLTRSGRDFSVDDVAIATRALPHLTRLAASPDAFGQTTDSTTPHCTRGSGPRSARDRSRRPYDCPNPGHQHSDDAQAPGAHLREARCTRPPERCIDVDRNPMTICCTWCSQPIPRVQRVRDDRFVRASLRRDSRQRRAAAS